jgi:acyl-CoA thioesterase-1
MVDPRPRRTAGPVRVAGASQTRRWILAAGGLALLAAVFGWFLWREPTLDFRRAANLTAPGDLIVFFGDSITQGYGVRPEDSFPSVVANDLGVAFLNAGVPGDTTAAGLTRLDRDVLSRRPRLTVVELGGNDYLRRVPLEDTLKNLETIVSTLVSQGSMVVLLETNVGLVGDPYLKGYRDVADRHGAVLMPDILRGILGNPDLKVDSIHPNARGHLLIAERVLKVLRPLLRAADNRRGSVQQPLSGFACLTSVRSGTLQVA